MRSPVRESILAWPAALIAVTSAFILTRGMWRFLFPTPFPLFFAAVMISAWLGGWGPGLAATGLSALICDYFFIAPYQTFLGGKSDLVRLGAFVLGGGIITSLAAARRRAEREARRRKLWLEQTLAGISDAVIATDASGRILFLNRVARTVSSPVEVDPVGEPFCRIFPILDMRTGARVRCPVASAVEGRSIVGLTDCFGLEPAQGSEIRIEGGAAPLRDADGEIIGVVIFFRDVTDRVAAKEALRRTHDDLERRVRERTAELSEANSRLEAEVVQRGQAEKVLGQVNPLLRALVQASPLAIATFDFRDRVTTWNQAAERIFGWSQTELLGRPWPNSPTALREHPRGLPASSFREGEAADFEAKVRRKDGTNIEAGFWTASLQDDRSHCTGRLIIAADISDRKRAEEERRELLRRIVASQEEERHRIARELHDQMGQHLTAFLLGLRTLRDHVESRPGALEIVRRLRDLADLMGREVHRIALELRPTALDDWGLQIALTNYVGEWSRRSRVIVHLHCSGIESARLPSTVETALYRIVQEALNNVLKHAQAARVSLLVERRADRVLTIVEDDGRGFDAEAVRSEPNARKRLGLLGMEERVALVGGKLEIESGSSGTTLFIHIPISFEE